MRAALIVFAVAGMVASTVQAKEHVDVEKEIVALEQDSCEIQLKKQWGRFEQVFAEDFINVSTEGVISNKAQLMAALPGFDVSSCQIQVEHVIVDGETAIAVGRMEMASTYHTGPFRFLDTFLRRNGRWRLHASAQSAVAQ